MTAAQIDKLSPQRTTRCLLILFLFGICTRGYGDYSQTLKNLPQVWTDVLQGTASAPEQYRFGVVMAAYWLTEYVHIGHRYLKLSEAFWFFDLLGSMIAVLLLYALLVRTTVYAKASHAGQWFGSAAFVALTIYLVDWVNWYQKISTLPATCLVAVMLWIWTPRSSKPTTRTKQLLMSGIFLVLVAVLSFIRADVALAVCAGIFLASLTKLNSRLALPRRAAILCSLAAALLASGVQIYLMKVRYPQANYGHVHPFMIAHDWWKLQKWTYCLIFMAPFLWTLLQAIRRRFWGEGAEGAFLLAALIYSGMWIVMGRLDEVRIFLPMALVITPLTVQLAILKLQTEASAKQIQSL
jgi:hypothetical protein